MSAALDEDAENPADVSNGDGVQRMDEDANDANVAGDSGSTANAGPRATEDETMGSVDTPGPAVGQPFVQPSEPYAVPQLSQRQNQAVAWVREHLSQ